MKGLIREASEQEIDFVIDRLVDYNLSQVPSKQAVDFLWMNRVIEGENGALIAGISAKMYCWKVVYVDVLWVDEAFRGDGVGSKLLEEIEKEAMEHGCRLIHLDTFDFQGKDFYLKKGYEVFGVLEDCPEGHQRYFMKKNL